MTGPFDDFTFDLAPIRSPTGEEIEDNIRQLYKLIRALPPLPEYVAMHPAEWETFHTSIGDTRER